MGAPDEMGVEEVRWPGQITGSGNPATATFTGQPEPMEKEDINSYRGY